MARLGRIRLVAPSVPGQKAFAQARAGGDHGDSSSVHALTVLQRSKGVRAQPRNGVREGDDVIEQSDDRNVEGGAEPPLVDRPAEVRQLGPAVDDWPGNGEGGTLDRCRR